VIRNILAIAALEQAMVDGATDRVGAIRVHDALRAAVATLVAQFAGTPIAAADARPSAANIGEGAEQAVIARGDVVNVETIAS